MHKSYRDISAEKKLQTALLAEKNFFPTIADCANAIITIIEPDGTMSMLNHYAQQITGYIPKRKLLVSLIFGDAS